MMIKTGKDEMQLQIPEGAHLHTSDEEDLGRIRQFVVSPSTSEVTHLLVEKGVFFTDDRVVPIEAIDHVDEDGVFLIDGIDPADLPRFVRDDYTPVEDTATPSNTPTGYMWRYPIAHGRPFPIYPTYPVSLDTGVRPEQGDDLAREEVIGGRTPVYSITGDKVGTVSEIHIDEAGGLSHLVVDLGFLSDEKVLPSHWIASIDSKGVHLAVPNHAVESLETVT